MVENNKNNEQSITHSSNNKNENNPNNNLKPRHPGRVSQKALEYLKTVVNYGFGNSSGAGMVGKFERLFAKKFGEGNFGIAHCNVQQQCTLHLQH